MEQVDEHMKGNNTTKQLFVFAIGMEDGTWRKEIVESLTIVEAQCKIYNTYPKEDYPDITFRVFLHSL